MSAPNNVYYYYITKYTKKSRNLIGCSLINIGHIIPNIGFTAVPVITHSFNFICCLCQGYGLQELRDKRSIFACL